MFLEMLRWELVQLTGRRTTGQRKIDELSFNDFARTCQKGAGLKLSKTTGLKLTALVACSILATGLGEPVGAQKKTASAAPAAHKNAQPGKSTAPAPAPSRFQSGPPASQGLINTSDFGAPAGGSQVPEEKASDGPPERSSTSVSLQGGVTRLDAGAAQSGNSSRPPLQGKVGNAIETPLAADKPRSAQVTPQMFQAWLQDTHKDFVARVSDYAPESVVVVKGQWDDSAKTLTKFGIPHERISGGQLKNYPLDRTRVLIVDCAGDLSRQACQRVRDFVSRGGYLLSTDWALDNFLSNTFRNNFGEYVIWNHGQNRDSIYDATVSDADPVLFNRVVTNAHWKLDQESHLIRVVNRDAVRVLVTSRQLQADDPDRQGILAVEFPFGRGYVLHMAGHFDNNSKMPIGNFLPDPAPVIGISMRQALAANFVVAGLQQTRIPIKNQR